MYRLAAGGILTANLCAGLGSHALAQGESNNPARQQSPADADRKPDADNKPVTLRTIQDAINRIASAVEAQKDEADAKRKDEREESDLDAQRQMVRWAKNMFWPTLGSLLVTFAGVILVWRTLRHTRDAAVAARDMVVQAEATTKAAQDSVKEARKATKFAQITADAAREALAITDRAWIRIEVELTDPLVFGPETISTSVQVTFRNIGKAPATNLTTLANLHADDVSAGKEARERTSQRDLSGMLRHLGLGQALFPGEAHVEEYGLEVPAANFTAAIAEANRLGAESEEPYTVTSEHPCILAGVSYFLAGDRTQRFTFAAFQIRSVDARHPGWDGKESEFIPAELTVRPGFMGSFIK